MRRTIIFTLLLICSLAKANSDTSNANFLPLKLGNKFIYKYSEHINDTINIRVSIDRDTVLNNRRYYYCQNAPWGTGFFRVDTITKSIYKYDASNSCGNYYYYETIIDSLASIPIGQGRCNYSIVYSTISQSNIFGIQTSRLYVFAFANMFISSTRDYYLNFGLVHRKYSDTHSNIYWGLQGCVINGIVYGDTTMYVTGVSNLTSEIPNSYSLSQNYPNPFNPQTKIKFDVPKTSFTKLIIYDLLGREVTTLVNEELKPGTYQADWDASSFSSGVYFYKIISGDYIETKKMVLMK